MDQTDHRSFASKRLEVKRAFQWLTPALTGLFIWKRPSDQNFCQVGPPSLHFLSNPEVQTCSRCGGIAGIRWSGLVKRFSIQQRDSLSDSPPKRIPWIHWKAKRDWGWNFDYQKVKVTKKPLAKVINVCSQNYHPHSAFSFEWNQFLLEVEVGPLCAGSGHHDRGWQQRCLWLWYLSNYSFK